MNREEQQKWEWVLRAARQCQAEGKATLTVDVDVLIAVGKALEGKEQAQTLTEAARQGFYGPEANKG